MLKIKDNVDLKELEKFGIYPIYECDETTGKTRIKELATDYKIIENLKFKRKKKVIARLYCTNIYSNPMKFVLKINNKVDEMINLDVLYDLIKADLVEKVGK